MRGVFLCPFLSVSDSTHLLLLGEGPRVFSKSYTFHDSNSVICVFMQFITAIRSTTVDACSFALLVNFLDPIFPRFRGPFNLVFENNLLLLEPHKMFRVLSSIYLKPGE